MNILHIITGLENGGAEGVLFRLITADIANKHVVISLTGEAKYGPLLRDSAIPVYTLNMPKGRLSFSGIRRLIKLLKSIKPDIVQTWMYHADLIGGIVARLAGFKNISWCIRHSTHDSKRTPVKLQFIVRLCALVSWFIPRQIISCSKKGADVHAALGYQADKIKVIPNGYDLNVFCPKPEKRKQIREEIGVADAFVMGMVARWDPQKDHETLIKAWSYFAEEQGNAWVGVLIGDEMTPSNKELVKILNTYGVEQNVMLLGPKKGIENYMNAFDVHVLSSSFGEGFPNVVAEAMACGTPNVVTDVGDASLIVGNTGWVIPKKDAGSLAGAFVQAHEDFRNPESWQERQSKCIQRISSSFSITKMKDLYTKSWVNIL